MIKFNLFSTPTVVLKNLNKLNNDFYRSYNIRVKFSKMFMDYNEFKNKTLVTDVQFG